MNNSIGGKNILIVEDSDTQAMQVKNFLEQNQYYVQCASNGEEALQCISKKIPDIVLTDVVMPEMDGFEFCRRVKRNKLYKDIPIILLTSLSSPLDVLRGLESRANMYVVKLHDLNEILEKINYVEQNKIARQDQDLSGNVPILFQGEQFVISSNKQEILDFLICTYEIAIKMNKQLEEARVLLQELNFSLEQKIQQRTAELQYQATHDAQTNLINQQNLCACLNKTIETYQDKDVHIAICYFGLDNFKLINDSLGYTVGNQLLKSIAQRLQESLHEYLSPSLYDGNFIVGKEWGDIFAVAAVLKSQPGSIDELSKAIFTLINKPFSIKTKDAEGNEINNPFVIKISMGISAYPEHGGDAETLIKNAEIAMFYAKNEGKGKCLLYSPTMNSSTLERIMISNDLRKAVDTNELFLNYQPIIDLTTGEMIGVEALVRWNHPTRGIVYPNEFIDIAEKDHTIIKPMGEKVLELACIQKKEWRAIFDMPFIVAVNLSLNQLDDHSKDQFLSLVKRLITELQIDPNSLEIEVTERITQKNPEFSIEVMKDLKKLGVRLSIDDFGTGYSGLNYLSQFPVDQLKIDKSFIDKIPKDNDGVNLVKSIIDIGHRFNLKVLAEGVESKDQLYLLRDIGCDLMQGYYFSKPATSEKIIELFNNKVNVFKLE